MTKVGRKATVLLVAALVTMDAGLANAEDEATIVLHVANYAALSRAVLDQAESRVAKVYKAIGVRALWADSEESVRGFQKGELHLTILLLSRDMAEKKISTEGVAPHVLGQAHPATGRAYIFCTRIATMPGDPKLFAIPLAVVIAHEVGHLLLPSNSHSRSGIMREVLDSHSLDFQSFEAAQARTIRTMLSMLRPD